MKNPRTLGKLLLWAHLFVCVVWLYILRSEGFIPEWMIHVILWSILGVQFTWGLTVGLLVGPARKQRSQLWWSLLLVFMPLYPIGILIFAIAVSGYPMLALIYMAFFAMILACETYCGVLLGAKLHSEKAED